MNYNNYYLSLEDRFIEITKFVEADIRNFETFSSEIAITFIAVCSEFEVVCKELCRVYSPDVHLNSMQRIRETLNRICPEMFIETVNLNQFNLSYKPLEDWSYNNPLPWWVAYNKVKHHRSDSYHLANLGNLIKALAGLQVVGHYYIWKFLGPTKSRHFPVLEMVQTPRIFHINNVNYYGPVLGDDVFEI